MKSPPQDSPRHVLKEVGQHAKCPWLGWILVLGASIVIIPSIVISAIISIPYQSEGGLVVGLIFTNLSLTAISSLLLYVSLLLILNFILGYVTSDMGPFILMFFNYLGSLILGFLLGWGLISLLGIMIGETIGIGYLSKRFREREFLRSLVKSAVEIMLKLKWEELPLFEWPVWVQVATGHKYGLTGNLVGGSNGLIEKIKHYQIMPTGFGFDDEKQIIVNIEMQMSQKEERERYERLKAQAKEMLQGIPNFSILVQKFIYTQLLDLDKDWDARAPEEMEEFLHYFLRKRITLFRDALIAFNYELSPVHDEVLFELVLDTTWPTLRALSPVAGKISARSGQEGTQDLTEDAVVAYFEPFGNRITELLEVYDKRGTLGKKEEKKV